MDIYSLVGGKHLCGLVPAPIGTNAVTFVRDHLEGTAVRLLNLETSFAMNAGIVLTQRLAVPAGFAVNGLTATKG